LLGGRTYMEISDGWNCGERDGCGGNGARGSLVRLEGELSEGCE
jgi:hypothetical protein